MSLYVVCIDLGASPEEQCKQIQMWLQYLHSILCNHINKAPIEPQWKVIIVGTRADLALPTTLEHMKSTKAYQVSASF